MMRPCVLKSASWSIASFEWIWNASRSKSHHHTCTPSEITEARSRYRFIPTLTTPIHEIFQIINMKSIAVSLLAIAATLSMTSASPVPASAVLWSPTIEVTLTFSNGSSIIDVTLEQIPYLTHKEEVMISWSFDSVKYECFPQDTDGAWHGGGYDGVLEPAMVVVGIFCCPIQTSKRDNLVAEIANEV